MGFTQDQLRGLNDIEEGDLVIVTSDSDPGVDDHMVFVTDILRDGHDIVVDLTVAPIEEATHSNPIFAYCLLGDTCVGPDCVELQDGRRRATPELQRKLVDPVPVEMCSLEKRSLLSYITHHTALVIVTNGDMVRSILHGDDCTACGAHEGVVPPYQVPEMRDRGVTERASMSTSSIPPLCPFCVGPGLSKEHERFVEEWEQRLVRDVDAAYELLTHFRVTDQRREELGYSEFQPDISAWRISVEDLEQAQHQHDIEENVIEPAEEAFSAAADSEFVSNLPTVTFVPTSIGLTEPERCLICQENFVPGAHLVELPCKHRFDMVCIREWLSANNTCPKCRYTLPEADATSDEEQIERPTDDDDMTEEEDKHEDEHDPPKRRLATPERQRLSIEMLYDSTEEEEEEEMASNEYWDNEGDIDEDDEAQQEEEDDEEVEGIDYPASQASISEP